MYAYNEKVILHISTDYVLASISLEGFIFVTGGNALGIKRICVISAWKAVHRLLVTLNCVLPSRQLHNCVQKSEGIAPGY